MQDDDKVIIIDFVLNSIDNGFIDEDVRKELLAIEKLAKTIKNGLDKKVSLQLINDTITERANNWQRSK